MTKVSCISFEGEETIIDAPNGMSLMEAAVKNGVTGIDADCGGACACATCHVYVDPQWSAQTGSAKATEDEMLAFVSERADNSRLACQIIISDALEGLVVRIPESQG